MNLDLFEPGVRLSLHQDKDERDYDEPLKEGVHPLLGRRRINLTFRVAG